MASELTYLGVLAAPTAQGRRAVAIALSGAVDLYQLVDAGFVKGAKAVEDWLWTAGINPDESYSALPSDILLTSVLLPEIGRKTLVVSHGDMDIPLVDELVTELGRQANPAIVSGIELTGPFIEAINGAAGRRAIALQARYEAAIEKADVTPLVHKITGKVDVKGALQSISIAGDFAKGNWTLEAEDDALFLLMSWAGMSQNASFEVEDGPAAGALARLGREIGLFRKMAA